MRCFCFIQNKGTSSQIKVLWLVLFTLFVARAAAANDDTPPYGHEFTFGNSEVDAAAKVSEKRLDEVIFGYQKKVGTHLQKHCTGSCTVTFPESPGDALVVKYSDGNYFKFFSDDGVMEVTGTPLSVEQTEAFEKRIQADIFDATKRYGLEPSPKGDGGGHVSQGIRRTFRKRPLFFRNMNVDNANNVAPILVSGRVKNPNCTAVVCLPNEAQDAYSSVIHRFDEGHGSTTIEGLSSDIYTHVYSRDDVARLAPPGMPGKAHAHNIAKGRFDTDVAVIEYRYLPAQKSAADYIAHIKLIDARTKLVKEMSDKGIRIPLQLDQARKLLSAPNLDVVNAYYKYVYESGLRNRSDWRRYQLAMRGHYHGMDADFNFRKEIIAYYSTAPTSCQVLVGDVIGEHIKRLSR